MMFFLGSRGFKPIPLNSLVSVNENLQKSKVKKKHMTGITTSGVSRIFRNRCPSSLGANIQFYQIQLRTNLSMKSKNILFFSGGGGGGGLHFGCP